MWIKESSINWSQGYPLQAGEYGKKRGRDGGGKGREISGWARRRGKCGVMELGKERVWERGGIS